VVGRFFAAARRSWFRLADAAWSLFKRLLELAIYDDSVGDVFSTHLPAPCAIFPVGKIGARKSTLARLGPELPIEPHSQRPDLVRVTRQESDFGRWEIASRRPILNSATTLLGISV
jgi:hypothetical protein